MGDTSGAVADNRWSRYLKTMATRPGWTVTRLADESGIRRGTIHDWIKYGRGEKVTIETVVAIARGSGDHPVNTFIAAAGLVEEEPQDRAIGLILLSDLPDDEKERQIARIEADREQQEQKRLVDTQELLRIRRAS